MKDVAAGRRRAIALKIRTRAAVFQSPSPPNP